MNPVIPRMIAVAMMLTVAGVYFAILWILGRVGVSRPKAAIFIGLWLALGGVLGASGFLADFKSMPPRFPVLLIFQLGLLAWCIFFSPFKEKLMRIPQEHLIGLQVFRLPVELILSALATHALLPVELTFHGRNFDIIPGVAALGVAWLVRRIGEHQSRGLIIAWNILGLAFLVNIVGHGILATPYPIQVFHFEPDTRAMATFPIQWLPLFLVPAAFGLHLMSLKKALASRSRA